MEIRPLTDLDAQSYQQLRTEALELEPWAFTESTSEHLAIPLETIRRRLGSPASGNGFVMGAFNGGQLIAIAGFFRRKGEKIRHRGEIRGVYVKNEYRSKGIGKALLEELIRQLRSQPDLEQVALGVSVGNTSAKRLYESLGFEIYGRETNAVKIGGAYMDEELMVLYFSR
jgi:ribosomal protein S18 acetylase RimI-like enzyme